MKNKDDIINLKLKQSELNNIMLEMSPCDIIGNSKYCDGFENCEDHKRSLIEEWRTEER